MRAPARKGADSARTPGLWQERKRTPRTSHRRHPAIPARTWCGHAPKRRSGGPCSLDGEGDRRVDGKTRPALSRRIGRLSAEGRARWFELVDEAGFGATGAARTEGASQRIRPTHEREGDVLVA